MGLIRSCVDLVILPCSQCRPNANTAKSPWETSPSSMRRVGLHALSLKTSTRISTWAAWTLGFHGGYLVLSGCCSERVAAGCTQSPEGSRVRAEEAACLAKPTVPYEERVVKELGQVSGNRWGIPKSLLGFFLPFGGISHEEILHVWQARLHKTAPGFQVWRLQLPTTQAVSVSWYFSQNRWFCNLQCGVQG